MGSVMEDFSAFGYWPGAILKRQALVTAGIAPALQHGAREVVRENDSGNISIGLKGRVAALRMGAPVCATADRQLWERQSEAWKCRGQRGSSPPSTITVRLL